jgi:hypothetical protein
MLLGTVDARLSRASLPRPCPEMHTDGISSFVPSPNEFAPAEYGAFVDELHSNHQH